MFNCGKNNKKQNLKKGLLNFFLLSIYLNVLSYLQGSCGKKNLALNKKCGQSSHAGCGGAVDGNFNSFMATTFFVKNNVLHGETNPYWWVDIGSSCMVKLIKIYNRKDCCGKFSSNYRMFLYVFHLERQTLI